MTESILLDRLRSLKVAIVTHVYATGPAQELEVYLKDKVASLIFIGHPFKFAADIRSFCKIYQKGVIKKQTKAYGFRLPELLMYFKDLLYTFYWVIYYQGKLDIYFGVDPLNAFVGIILKKLGKVEKVILYTIDYTPKRFENKFLNWVYHRVDSFCVQESDFVWNLSARMAKARMKKGIKRYEHQMVVPIGVNSGKIEGSRKERVNRNYFVYMGHLRKNQGLELVVDGFSDIIKVVPDARLVIIGGGCLEAGIKKIVVENNLSTYVEFKGYLPEHSDVENILATCGIGLALYEPSPDSITWYTDPSKPKQYMASGLPVIITAVPEISEEIKSRGLGIVINYNRESFVNGALRLLRDDKLYFECRKNATEFVSSMRWDNIFSKALSSCL
ncbi:MAG: glycosyltransferase [Candidatus Omnitrophica bacterium]|nr:glycosyltransferase [Candidatus Omnitrophota bacterium]